MQSNSLTVLYAEDLEEDIFFMERAFKMSGSPYRLQTVRDGQHAIQWLNGEYPYSDRSRYPLPTLVILDIKMPTIGGLEVLEWMRSQSMFDDLPVYMLSSSIREEDREAAESLGANGFQIKTTNFNELLDFVNQITAWDSNQEEKLLFFGRGPVRP